MAKIIRDMFQSVRSMLEDPDVNILRKLEEIKEKEEYTDQMQEQLTIFLAECASQGLNEQSTRNVTAMIRITEELESIADSLYNLAIQAKRKREKKIIFAEEARKSCIPYMKLVNDFLDFTAGHIGKQLSKEELETALKFEEQVNTMRNKEKKSAQHRMQNGSDVRSELLFIDIIKHLEHIGDHSLNITQALGTINALPADSSV